MSLTQEIKYEAQRLGFPLVGVTTPELPPHFEAYSRWLDAGFHGEMEYLASERGRACRADPHRIMPECRSILVLGIPYSARNEVKTRSALSERLTGQIAAYACGEDYHVVLPKRLQSLVEFIVARADRAVKYRWYTDTGPLLERDLAQRAGLGWIGKNTCLIHPSLGSFFFLAEILLDIELEPDPPFSADYCGSCTRCLEACPAGCIKPGYMLEARRCISYLTIELKRTIPPDLRPLLGSWVFGCDVCQQVCPWNQKLIRSGMSLAPAEFSQNRAAPFPKLLDELCLTAHEFNHKYKNSPVKRAKRRGYLRNVAVALGNLAAGGEDPLITQALAQALHHDPEALVRAHAAWALSRLGNKIARQTLITRLASEPDPLVLSEITAALSALPDR